MKRQNELETISLKAKEWFKSVWATQTGKMAITFVGLLVGLSLIDSIFHVDHNTVKGYPTDYVYLVPLDMERYKAEFPDVLIARVTTAGDVKTIGGKGQLYECENREHVGNLPDHVKDLGCVFSIKNPENPIYTKLPLYLKKDGFKRVKYTGKYYTGFKPPEDYRGGSHDSYRKEPIDYASYRKRGIEGPILKLSGVVFNSKYFNHNNDERSYTVSFITEDGIERTRIFPPGAVVTERVKVNDIVEVRWVGSIPVFCKVD